MPSLTAGGSAERYSRCEGCTAVSFRLNILPPYHPAVVLLGGLPKGAKNLRPHKNLHTHVYGSFFSTTAKTGEQTRCPSVCKGINDGSDLTTKYRFSTKKK